MKTMVILIFTIILYLKSDEIQKIASKTFPDRSIVYKSISEMDLNQFFSDRKKTIPAIKSINLQIEKMKLDIAELEKSYVPSFYINTSQQFFDLKERLVTINTKVPVEWDNDNPEQVDINLPNGGHGILWLPKPTEYEYKDIEIHASRPYQSMYTMVNTGFNYQYHSGVSLNILNLGVSKRYSPDAYGFSWFSSLDNSITIPVLKILNSEKSERELQKDAMDKQIKILEKVENSLFAGERDKLIDAFLQLSLAWKQSELNKKMTELAYEQIEDYKLLVDRPNYSPLEKISIENNYNSIKNSQNIYYQQILQYSSKLMQNDSTFVVYSPEKFDIDSLLNNSKERFIKFSNEKEELLFKDNFTITSIENSIKSAVDLLSTISPKNKIQLDLVGSLGLSTSSDLGYKTFEESIEKVFVDPDGLNASVGVQFSIPLSMDNINYQYHSALKNIEIMKAELEQNRLDFLSGSREMKMNILNLEENLRSITENSKFSSKRYYEINEFYKLSRVTRLEYNSCMMDMLKAEISVYESKIMLISAYHKFIQYIGGN
ncbi:MAG: TolC family protein [Candidatus Delongbacteria bacterium]|nr:TolC family protein [Candidatus Delongbacteria bacterium]MBN2835540.1 TolC family protein [Candidatus Delongbacteria bacterium]